METENRFTKLWPRYPCNPDLSNPQFNVETGEETISIIVGDPNKDKNGIALYTLEYCAAQEDARDWIMYYACQWMGREADLVRCKGVGVKELDDGRVEIRLRFDPPWYWSLIRESRRQSAVREATPESGTISAV